MNVTLYTRAGCHLCDSAETIIRRVLDDRPDVELDLVDVDADPDLVDRYTVRVPVVEVDGTEIAQYEVDEQTLRAALTPRSPTQPVEEPAAHLAPQAAGRPRRGGRLLRWFVLGIVAAVLLVGLTTASVALITPDVFVDECQRPQLVLPTGCGQPSTTS